MRPRSWGELLALVGERVARVRDDPAARMAARRAFYRRYGFGAPGSAGFGRAEIDFMQWQADRGLLAPLDHPHRPGSPYWRVTNEGVALDAELAAEGWEAGLSREGASPAVCAWLDYFARPDGATWYRAHNTSVVSAMVRHVDAAEQETREEQRFINEALYRLIHAEAMTLGALLGRAGAAIADPRRAAVAAVVRLGVLYPMRYPAATALAADVRRGVAGALSRAGLSLSRDRGVLRALVERYLRPLAGPALAPESLFSCFAGAIPIYPRRSAIMHHDEAP